MDRGRATPRGPRPEHGVGVSSPWGVPGAQKGTKTFLSDVRCIRPKGVSQIGRARTIARGLCRGITIPLPPRQRAGPLRPLPLPQFPPDSQLLRLAALTGRAGAVTRGRRGGAKTPRESSDRAAAPRPRGELEPCFRGPARPRPSPDPRGT